MTGSFHSLRNTTLELQRSTGNTARKDFSLLIQEFLQEFRILIVDILDTALLETAVLLTSTEGGVKYLISDCCCAMINFPPF